jgi:hypothetical protein
MTARPRVVPHPHSLQVERTSAAGRAADRNQHWGVDHAADRELLPVGEKAIPFVVSHAAIVPVARFNGAAPRQRDDEPIVDAAFQTARRRK